MQEPRRGRNRDGERKADDDVTWEKSKMQKWQAGEEERALQKVRDRRPWSGWPFKMTKLCRSLVVCTLLCYMVPVTHLHNGSQSALPDNEHSSKHTQRPVLFTHSHPCPDRTQNQTSQFKVKLCVIFGFIMYISGAVFLIQPAVWFGLACQTQKSRQRLWTP